MKIKNSQTKKLLRYILIGGGFIVLSIAAPMLPHKLLQAYLKNRRFQKKKFLQDIKRLKQRGLISVKHLANGSTRVTLLKEGKKIALEYDINNIKIKRPNKWDKIWRVVMFDIPNTQKKSRRLVYWKLKELGFYHLQKSVFIHPFPCSKEVDFIGSFFEVRNYMIFMKVAHLDKEKKLLHHFHIL